MKQEEISGASTSFFDEVERVGANIKNNTSAKKPIAIFDLDSTLNNLHEVMYKSFKKHFLQDKHHSTWDNYHLSHTYGLPYDSIITHIERYNLLDKSVPLPGAKELFENLKPHYELGILTARGCFVKPLNKTFNWLLLNKIIPHWVKIVETNKSEFIKQVFGNCDFFMDDCPQHLISVLESGIAKEVATLNYSWTKSLPKEVLCFDDLNEVSMYLQERFKYESVQ